MDIVFDDKTPIYIQIMNIIKKQIILKELKGGDKLASVRDLSSEFKVNPNTIQRAYKELEREGLAYTQRGMGTFVTEDENILYKLKKDTARDVMDAFVEGMKHLGFNDDEIVDMVSKKLKEEE
ncbi:MAG: GntR family transcriptional regulator [Clostridium sp.]|nr:GntR family transcriptional regulator [Clostridium sp.]